MEMSRWTSEQRMAMQEPYSGVPHLQPAPAPTLDRSGKADGDA